MNQRISPLLVSRCPFESLAREPENKSQGQWFLRNWEDALKMTLRDLRALPGVKRIERESSSTCFKDSRGKRYFANLQITIFLKKGAAVVIPSSANSSNPRTAEAIAAAECIERLSQLFAREEPRQQIDPSWVDWAHFPVPIRISNGNCFHSSPTLALKGALCELLERDAILTNWYSGGPIPTYAPSKSDTIRPHREMFESLGWRLRVHHWKHDRVEAHVVALSAVRSKVAEGQWNFLLGSAAGSSFAEAQERAYNELSGMLLDTRFPIRVPSKKTLLADQRPASRRLLYQLPEYVLKFQSRLEEASAPRHKGLKISDWKFVTESMRDLKSIHFATLPVPRAIWDHVFCVRAYSQELQGLDFLAKPEINYQRVASRYGTTRGSICKTPHPIA